jgi:glyoxylase-like metal-dependent hydrolase (beta-lactamase superfamily II)
MQPVEANVSIFDQRSDEEQQAILAALKALRAAEEDQQGLPNIGDQVRPGDRRRLVELVEMNHRFSPEVHLTPFPDHTPGDVSVVIESEGQRAVITHNAADKFIPAGRPRRLMVSKPIARAPTASLRRAKASRRISSV